METSMELAGKVTKMLEANSRGTGLIMPSNAQSLTNHMLKLAERGDAFIISSYKSKRKDEWLIVQTANGRVLKEEDGSYSLGMVVSKNKPHEKDIIDLFFSIKRNRSIEEALKKIEMSNLKLNI